MSMEAILLLCMTVFLGLSRSDGSHYEEIAQLDEMLGKSDNANTSDKTSSTPPQNTIPTPTMGQPPIPPKPPTMGQQSAPPKPPTMGQPPIPPKPPESPVGFAGMPPATPPPTSSQNGFSLEGFDFEAILSTSIDADAFTELDKNR